MADNVLASAEVEFFAAGDINTGKEGYYYRLSTSEEWCGPEESLEAGIEKVTEMLTVATAEFLKNALNLE